MDAGTRSPVSRASDPHSAADVADTVGALGVGAGMVTMALFPLAIPIIALTAVALLPLLVPVVALGLVVAFLALPVLAARAVGRRVRRARRRAGAPERAPTPAGRGA